MALPSDLYFNDEKLIYPHLIQLYHTPLLGDKRKRTNESTNHKADYNDKKKPKLAIDADKQTRPARYQFSGHLLHSLSSYSFGHRSDRFVHKYRMGSWAKCNWK